jgi:hypothetical protein
MRPRLRARTFTSRVNIFANAGGAVLLLPIAALALLAFFLIVSMLCVAGACEERERKRSCMHEPIFSGLNLNASDENARLVWATQLPALQYLESTPGGGISSSALRPWYEGVARCYPALYEGHSFDEWLAFLEQSRVVGRLQGRLLLAAHGRNILDQCRRTCGHDSGWPR